MTGWLAVALAALLCGCSAGPDESRAVNSAAARPDAGVRPPASTAPSPAPAQVTSPYQRSFSNPFVAHSYKVAVNGCFYYPPDALAKQFGTTTDREAIARAYAALSKEGEQRDASYLGCLEGLSAPGAGQRKQFAR